MSALKSRSNSLAGLTLDAVLGGEIVIPSSPPSPPPLPQTSLVQHRPTSQTVLDITREESQKEGHKDRTTWQIGPRGSRAKGRAQGSTNDTFHLQDLVCAIPMSDPPGSSGRAMFTRGSSMRIGSKKNPDNSADVSIPGDGPPSRSFKAQLSRHDSVRDHGDGEEDNRRRHPAVTFVDVRQMSAREAVAAQEAAEAEAAAAASDDENGDDEEEDDSEEAEEKSSAASAPKQTMSLMDLLQETDRQMGLTGSRYAMDEEEEYEEDDNDEEEEGDGELNCCVCQVKIKSATFTPCGHTFCKLCSKELMAQKGHCPVCSSFVLEFLEIF